MTKAARTSYWFIAITILLVGWLHLGTLLLATLFSYLLLSRLQFAGDRKWVPVVLFIVLLLGITYGLGHFARQTVQALPNILSEAVPKVIALAEQYKVELPFADYDEFKEKLMDSVKEARNLSSFANFAKIATTEFTTQVVFLIVGCVVAVSIFLNAQLVLDRASHPVKNNLYTAFADEIAQRFRSFYRCFVNVMGAQIIISAINTTLTSVFIFAASVPHAVVVIGVTFLCGLLPVVGNLISNTVIIGICFTISPKKALAALIFLVVIHKLEYFLNSKIIGDRIKNPVWLTLLGLVVGQKLMGIPGMILAPVVLNYLKVEASRIEVIGKTEETPPQSARPAA